MDSELIKLTDKAGTILLRKNYTIAVAESVTSGTVQCAFSLAKNTISFYQGGITVYNIGQKCRHLSVEPTHAINCNCVSQQVSDQMAIGVARMFTSDIGVGITGYASPVPEQDVKKLFAFMSISKNGRIIFSKKINAAQMAPYDVQVDYAKKLMRHLFNILS